MRWAAIVVALAGCTAAAPVASDDFDRAVAPVLERRCGGCHGVPDGGLAALGEDRARLLRWEHDAQGRLATPAQRAAARAACLDDAMIDREGGAEGSALLLAPLSPTWAGPARTHPEVFASPDDPDFVTLRAWLVDTIGAAAPAAPPATAGARAFVDEVHPVLERQGCLSAACHGPSSFSDLKLEPRIPLVPGGYTAAMLRRNRTAMLGAGAGQPRLVALAGDAEQSRQLKKIVPVERGGILHKGGNRFVMPGDPDHDTLRRWLALEAEEARAAVGLDPTDRGLVFVRRPRATPERFFEDDAPLLGADLWWRTPDGAERNLTAALHPDAPVDLRAPAIDYRGERVVFAMRRGGDPLNVWELELATGAARQLTFSEDPTVHWRDPSYVPDPDDPAGADLDRVAIVMVSNVAGERGIVSPEGILGEAEGGAPTTIVDDERTEAVGTYAGRRIRIVAGVGVGEVRVVRASRPGAIVLDRPLPTAPDGTTHYVIDAVPRTAPRYDLYRMRRAAPGDERRTFAETAARMTWAAGQIRSPAMRSTGEVFVTALRTGWLGSRPFFHGAVFRVHDDGSNFHTHFGNRSELPILAGNRELPDGLEVRIGRDADSWWGGLVAIGDHQLGPPIDPRNPIDDLDHPLDRGAPAHAQHAFVRSWVPIDPAARAGGISPGGAYRDVAPMLDGSLVVAYAPGPIDLADPDAAPDFDLVRLVPDPAFQGADGLGSGGFRREPLVVGPAAELWPVPVRARFKEPLHKAVKHAVARFGEPGTTRSWRGYPDGTPALLEVYDLVLLDAFFEQTAPAGERHLDAARCDVHGEATPAEREITTARVIGAAPSGRAWILAEVPLTADASFQVELPSGVPFDLQAVSRDGLALSSPGRWLYALPGEKHTLSIPRRLYAQTCEGCHGSMSGDRTSGFGVPDAVTSASRTEAIWDPATRAHRPPANADGAAVVGGFGPVAIGFAEDVAPILDARCGACHAELVGAGAAAAVTAWLDPGRLSARSPLVERLLGRELDAPGAAPPAPHPADLPDGERLTITRWIDLGAPDRRAW